MGRMAGWKFRLVANKVAETTCATRRRATRQAIAPHSAAPTVVAMHSPKQAGRFWPAGPQESLELDFGSHRFELSLDLLGFVLGNAFLYGLAASLDQVLGFLQP